jgi:hypothetical protein
VDLEGASAAFLQVVPDLLDYLTLGLFRHS